MALPTLLMTRPVAGAQAFLKTLDPAVLAAVRVHNAPLMEIVATGLVPDFANMRGVIFTSVNGVLHAPNGLGRPAYCVGSQTTTQAHANGWRAQQMGDTAQELLEALLKLSPDAPLLHLGGTHTRGDIAQTLISAGIVTHHLALYEQHLLPLDPLAHKALEGPCIVPVFSPRSARQLARQAAGCLENAHVIALSGSVAAAFEGEKTAECIILPAPQAGYMRNEVENLCLSLSLA